jgi:hypothetical protein
MLCCATEVTDSAALLSKREAADQSEKYRDEVRPRVHSLLRAHLPVRLRSMSARASQSKYMQWLTVAPDLCSFVFLARLRWHWRSGMRRTG